MRNHSTAKLTALLLAMILAGSWAYSAERSIEEVFAGVETSVVTLWTEKPTGLRNAEGVAETTHGNGSGVLIEGGRILTAAHVVHSANAVVVEYFDGTRAPARIIGSVVQGDVALLQLTEAPPRGVKPAVLGDSDKVRIGSRCIVVGAPHQLTHTLTVGYISARRAEDHPKLDILDIEHFQTDAAINPGNSGGPLFDMNGQVIGIASYNITTTGASVGLGFAVTSNTARRHLLERSPVWSGMTEFFLTGELARAFQLPEGQSGFLLQQVAEDSPADRLGLRGGSIPAVIGGKELLLGGDVLLEAMGYRIDSPEMGLALLEALKDIRPNTKVSAVVLRSGKALKFEAVAKDVAPWLVGR